LYDLPEAGIPSAALLLADGEPPPGAIPMGEHDGH
jgi:hypothetical protein